MWLPRRVEVTWEAHGLAASMDGAVASHSALGWEGVVLGEGTAARRRRHLLWRLSPGGRSRQRRPPSSSPPLASAASARVRGRAAAGLASRPQRAASDGAHGWRRRTPPASIPALLSGSGVHAAALARRYAVVMSRRTSMWGDASAAQQRTATTAPRNPPELTPSSRLATSSTAPLRPPNCETRLCDGVGRQAHSSRRLHHLPLRPIHSSRRLCRRPLRRLAAATASPSSTSSASLRRAATSPTCVARRRRAASCTATRRWTARGGRATPQRTARTSTTALECSSCCWSWRARTAPGRFATRLQFIADGGKATGGGAFPCGRRCCRRMGRCHCGRWARH